VVLEAPDRRVAFEVEFAAKDPRRLWRILDAYRGLEYTQPRVMVVQPDVARRVARYIRSRSGSASDVLGRPSRICEVTVEPWPFAPSDIQEHVRRAIAEHGELTKRERH